MKSSDWWYFQWGRIYLCCFIRERPVLFEVKNTPKIKRTSRAVLFAINTHSSLHMRLYLTDISWVAGSINYFSWNMFLVLSDLKTSFHSAHIHLISILLRLKQWTNIINHQLTTYLSNNIFSRCRRHHVTIPNRQNSSASSSSKFCQSRLVLSNCCRFSWTAPYTRVDCTLFLNLETLAIRHTP